jgi:gluconolactonase
MAQDCSPLDGTAVEVLATGLDGPEDIVWDADRGVLYAGGKHGDLYRVHLDGTVENLLHFGAGSFVLGMALDSVGRIYVCERGNARFLRVDPATLAIEDYSAGTPERPLITPNYPAFAADGTLYLSDSGQWGAQNGVIFRISTDRTTEVWSTAPSDFTNGLAVSPSGDAVYVAESKGSKVWRIPVLPSGAAGDPEVIWDRPRTVPDGLAFDADGMLYVSLYRPDAIHRIDPATGETRVFVDDWTGQFLMAPTNIAFAGAGLDLLVTANLNGDHLNVLRTALPAAGLPLRRPEITR